MAELGAIEVARDAPRGGRRPLRELDAGTREAIAASGGVIDASAAVTAWERARGYALHQAAMIIPYYATTNPGFVMHAKRTIDQLLGDS